MAPDLSEKLLGIDIDDADDRTRRNTTSTDEDQEELEQFIFFGLGDYQLAVPVETIRTLAEVPDELTRVPRAPAAIEGMIDLRGDITAVIDPRVHFPHIETENRASRERLLVLDRPADQQSAAIRVDDVIGVETVPVRDILDETTIEDRALSGDALEHPLVAALIEQEHESRPDVSGVVASSGSGDVAAETGADTGAGGASALSAPQGSIGSADDSSGSGTPFALESDSTETESATEPAPDGESATREIVVTGTPLVDVEKLLLASGQRE